MNDVKSCLLVGVGGQGAILISKIMSNGFMQAGFDVKQSEVHGMAQRGGNPVQIVLARGQHMRLLVVQVLDAVLHLAQKGIGRCQGQGGVWLHQVRTGQAL